MVMQWKENHVHATGKTNDQIPTKSDCRVFEKMSRTGFSAKLLKPLNIANFLYRLSPSESSSKEKIESGSNI